MKKTVKILLIAGIAISLQACALLPKSRKAPCGPTAGLTGPCGNRVPLNMQYRPRLDGVNENVNFKQLTIPQPAEIQV
ncbi:hypothetical protein MNBD_ALPHA06-1735 [hydrothermal vent metagenome]|uniref:Lipoprotein n=1 Tax=hydrothermal vent metagenome TaxID=652676 RepID=A0A3B0S346_9ZZZZ